MNDIHGVVFEDNNYSFSKFTELSYKLNFEKPAWSSQVPHGLNWNLLLINKNKKKGNLSVKLQVNFSCSHIQ